MIRRSVAPSVRAVQDPARRATPAVVPELALASAIGNRAFASLAVLAREPAAPTVSAERDLTPNDVATLEGAVIPSLQIAINVIAPSREQVALALRHLEPALAALDTLRPRLESEAQEGIRDARRRLLVVKTRLETILDGKRIQSAAEPWMLARNEAVMALAHARRDDDRREAELIEGSVMPLIDLGLERLTHPGADYEAIYRDSLATLSTIRSVGVSMVTVTKPFTLGREALKAIIDEQPETVAWAEGMMSLSAGWLTMIVDAEKAPPEGGAPDEGRSRIPEPPSGDGRSTVPAPPPGPDGTPLPPTTPGLRPPPYEAPPSNPWRKPLGPPYP